ncbi:MAG TPA: M28 family peptidase [Thermomicrobiaceae bacterium]|nr:M28 family peptidase [Thermomicrobiaceae bacterium]
MADESMRAMDKTILSEIWTSDDAWKNLAHLCDDIGHRFAGSELEHQAARFLKQKMEEYGLQNVRLEEFEMASWRRGPCDLELTAPLQREISAIAMPYCPSGDIEADVVDVGEGELADFERLGDQIKGKIVLTDAETNAPGQRKSHRTDKYNWAYDRGALAVVFMNQNPGLLHITGSITGRNPAGKTAADREAPIPGIGISYEGGKLIRRLAERGTPRLKLSTQNETYDSTSANVIGEIVGSEYPNQIVIIGGHYDGHDIAQGAGDDGAGTIVGLEAGRALARLKGQLKRTVRVVCWGSEEVGLLGAWHHAAAHQGENIRFAMNLDGAGRGSGGAEQVTLSLLPEVTDFFGGLKGDLNYDFGLRDELNSHSDHFPFALRGIPNGTLNSRDATAGMVGRGYGHTEADTLDKVQLRGLQMSAILVARLALRLANDDQFPGRQREIDEVRDQLKEAGIHDRIVRTGRFPAEEASTR